MAGSAKAPAARQREFRKEPMTAQLANLILSEALLEAVHAARANGMSDYAVREALLAYAGGPRGA